MYVCVQVSITFDPFLLSGVHIIHPAMYVCVQVSITFEPFLLSGVYIIHPAMYVCVQVSITFEPFLLSGVYIIHPAMYVCVQVSITFDPFLYLSLPIPKSLRLLPVTFMWRDPYRKPVRVGHQSTYSLVVSIVLLGHSLLITFVHFYYNAFVKLL